MHRLYWTRIRHLYGGRGVHSYFLGVKRLRDCHRELDFVEYDRGQYRREYRRCLERASRHDNNYSLGKWSDGFCNADGSIAA